MAGRRAPRRRRRRQAGGFLSRYDFAYARIDSVNQAAHHVKKIAPGLINHAVYKVGEQTRSVSPQPNQSDLEKIGQDCST